MDSVNFIVYIKTNDIYEDFAEDVEKSYGTSNYELNRPLLKEQESQCNERWISWKNHEKVC